MENKELLVFTEDIEAGEIYMTPALRRYAVHDNKINNKKPFGDSLFKTLDEAKKEQVLYFERAKQRAKNEIEFKAQEKAAQLLKEVLEDLDGFDAEMSLMKRGRVLKTLNRQVSWSRIFRTRKEHIKQIIKEGGNVKFEWGGRRLYTENDTFYDEGVTTKTGMDFAQYLINKLQD